MALPFSDTVDRTLERLHVRAPVDRLDHLTALCRGRVVLDIGCLDETALLKRDGTLCLVGVPEHPHPSPNVGPLIFRRKAIAGSLIGGLPETQEMLDFCAARGIVSEIEMIRADQIDAAYERMVKSDVKYRFVIDCASMG